MIELALENDASETELSAGFLDVGQAPSARRIAYLRRKASDAQAPRPGLVWVGGFRSDMLGTKATDLDRYAAERGCACVRFDYSGHGRSGGRFEDGTIGVWLEETLAVMRGLTSGPQVIAGSSMGAWLALLAARSFAASGEADRVKGLVLIAPAVDFTERLIWERMLPKARKSLMKDGVWLRPSSYSSDPYPITKTLIEEARQHLLLGGTIRTGCPVHILHGMRDEDVPWRHAVMLAEHLAGDPVTVTLVKDGDHRLSRDDDLARLRASVDVMVSAPLMSEMGGEERPIAAGPPGAFQGSFDFDLPSTR